LFLKRIDVRRLKFVDESHFVPKCLRKRKVIGMKNQRVWIQVKDLHGKHSSMTLLTSLSHDIPIYFNWRVQSNTGKDFLLFIGSCIVNGYLSEGDYLIVDNASVHRDEENLPTLCELLDTFGITLVYLPTYSPEFNPCELVFQYIKKKIREGTIQKTLLSAVIDVASDLNSDIMNSFYDQCCNFEKLTDKINSGCF